MFNPTQMTQTVAETANRPMGEWFTDLSETIQAEIMVMVNEDGYPLDDIKEFIGTYGPEAFKAGHYVAWCELSESGYHEYVISSFVEEFGIDAITEFEDNCIGTFASMREVVESMLETHAVEIPEWVAIDYKRTYEDMVDSMYFEVSHSSGLTLFMC